MAVGTEARTHLPEPILFGLNLAVRAKNQAGRIEEDEIAVAARQFGDEGDGRLPDESFIGTEVKRNDTVEFGLLDVHERTDRSRLQQRLKWGPWRRLCIPGVITNRDARFG